jgi:hypothetical protein
LSNGQDAGFPSQKWGFDSPRPLSVDAFEHDDRDLAGGALRRVARYQAWLAPQCGQSTEVETSALKAYPQWQE